MKKGKILRWRIVFVLLLAAFLPLVLSGVGSWIVFGNLLEQKSSELLHTIVQGHAHAIEANLSERLHLLQLAARSGSVEEMGTPARLRALLDDLNLSSRGGFVDLGVIDGNGDHLAYVGPYDLTGRNYSEAGWFNEVTLCGAYISDVFLGFRNVPHCIVAVRTVDAGRPWILRATINSNQFDELVQTGIMGESGDSYIVSREGTYQTTPREGALLGHCPTPMTDYHRGVREHRVQANGSDIIRVTTWINNRRWLLVVEQDVSIVKAPVNQAIANGIPVVALAILLLVGTTFVATWHLANRIDKANAEREQMSHAFLRSAKLASIGELATGLAHEINNPLAIISAEHTNILDVLDESEASSGQHEMILGSVKRSNVQLQRCASITKKMLQFGRKQDSQVKPTNLAARLREVLDLMQRHAKVRNITIHSEIEEHLPNVLVDPVELEQVLVNLINNGIDAMPNGGEIVISAFRKGDETHLKVSDNGIGIPREELDRVFEPFFTTKPAGKGTGLGLSVCYGIVRSWNGDIKAESVQGKGTTIHIRLPLHSADRSAD